MEREIIFLVFCSVLITKSIVNAGVHPLANTSMKPEDRPLWIADALQNDPVLTDKLWKIGEAAAPLLKMGGSGKLSAGMKLYVLDSLPILLRDPRFKGVLWIVGDEMSKVNITGVPDKMAPQYVIGNTNYIRIIQRVLMSGSAKDVLGPRMNMSEQCYNDVTDFADSLVVFSPWALHMFDAFGKPSSGVQKGNTYFVGSWDECYNVQATIPDHSTVLVDPADNITYVLGNRKRNDTVSFKTKFCKAQFRVPDSFIQSFNVDTRGLQIKLTWGLCLPESCRSSDIGEFFKLAPFAKRNIPFDNGICFEEQTVDGDSSAIAAVVVLAAFGALILIGTSIEVYLELTEPTHRKTHYSPEKFELQDRQTEEMSKVGSESGGDYKKEGIYPQLGAVNGGFEKTQHDEKVNNENAVKEIENGKAVVADVNNRHPADTDKEVVGKRAQGVLARCLRAFSIYTNVPKLLAAKSNASAIGCVHGIRFLSITWIVLGHTYNYGIISATESPTLSNLVDADALLKRATFRGVQGGTFAVDSFFVLSGFLVVWLQLKELKKKRSLVNNASYWIMYYFHRFWRLTPIYMIVLMTFGCLFRYLGHGPLWPKEVEAFENCKTTWWTNLLYVNNLVKLDQTCLGWTWYLANDMQFYVIAPIFIVIMHFSTIAGGIAVALLLAFGVGATALEEHKYNSDILHMKGDNNAYWDNVYITPWCRVTAYAVGMILGLILHKVKRQPFSKVTALSGWLIATAIALTTVYITQTEMREGGKPWTREYRIAYESLSRPLWSFCIAWIIFACYNFRGGVINSILSWNGFIPLSRLTYATYLIHPIAMMLYVYTKKTLLYLSDYDVIYLYLGHLTIAIAAAFVISVAFESPFMALEKILFRRK